MKILKKATQQNVILNKDYYNFDEINKMLLNKEICYFDENFKESYKSDLLYREMKETTFRIFTCNLKEIKVVIDDYKQYTTIAIGNNEKKYFVTL